MLNLTEETGLIKKVTRKVYWNARFVRLRDIIEEDDLVQMVYDKLLHNDNYKVYSDSYSLAGFIYRVANGCAISFSKKRSNRDEYSILDQPVKSKDASKPQVEYRPYYLPNIDLDFESRVRIISSMLSDKRIGKFVIRYNNEEIPLTLVSLFNFFINSKYDTREMSTHIINLKTKRKVTPPSFYKWWGKITKCIEKVLA